MSTTGDYIKVLYNDCLGGWQPSQKATDLYNKIMSMIDPLFQQIDSIENAGILRHDHVLIKCYENLGEEFDDELSKTRIEYIERKYGNHYYITNEKGCEKVIINFDKYQQYEFKNEIRKILTNNIIDNDHKIDEINKLIF